MLNPMFFKSFLLANLIQFCYCSTSFSSWTTLAFLSFFYQQQNFSCISYCYNWQFEVVRYFMQNPESVSSFLEFYAFLFIFQESVRTDFQFTGCLKGWHRKFGSFFVRLGLISWYNVQLHQWFYWLRVSWGSEVLLEEEANWRVPRWLSSSTWGSAALCTYSCCWSIVYSTWSCLNSRSICSIGSSCVCLPIIKTCFILFVSSSLRTQHLQGKAIIWGLRWCLDGLLSFWSSGNLWD